jgi:peptidoglycan/LPS O-acetylase OafA/YrhL
MLVDQHGSARLEGSVRQAELDNPRIALRLRAPKVSISAVSLSDEPSASASRAASGRMPFIDSLKGIAALLIVLHHLAFYGPLSDVAYPLAPAAMSWLSEYARMAVQAFIVIAGFGTARKLARLPLLGPREFGLELWSRYRRVGVPYLAALVLAIACNELARRWMEHPSISGRPTWTQLLAHATFLTHILGFEPLTAGVWYLAIDFQLLLVSLLLLALSQRIAGLRSAPGASPRLFVVLCGVLAVWSLFWLNRLSHLDNYAVYFFATYFLGMLVGWVLQGTVSRPLVAVCLGVVALALCYEFRPRLVVALATTLLLLAGTHEKALRNWPNNRLLVGLGRISYSLFLVHFPVCLVVNAWGSRHLTGSPHAALFGMLLAVVLSLLAAVIFYRAVEARCAPSRMRVES